MASFPSLVHTSDGGWHICVLRSAGPLTLSAEQLEPQLRAFLTGLFAQDISGVIHVPGHVVGGDYTGSTSIVNIVTVDNAGFHVTQAARDRFRQGELKITGDLSGGRQAIRPEFFAERLLPLLRTDRPYNLCFWVTAADPAADGPTPVSTATMQIDNTQAV
jgi:hypothetical protein